MKSIIPFIAKLITSVLAVASTYFVSKHLNKDVFGVYSSMLSIVFALGLITDWGFNVFGSQMIAQKKTHLEKVIFVEEAIYTKFWLCIFCSFLYIGFCIFSSNCLYYLLGLPVLFAGFLNPEWIARGFMEPQIVGYRQLLFSILNLVIFFIVYHFNFPKEIIFIAYALNTILSFIVVIPLINNEIRISTFFFKKKFELRKIRVKTTSVYFFGYVLNNLVYTSGILLLTFLSIDSVVGTYSSFYNVFATVVAPATIAYGLFNPKKHILSDEEFYKSYYSVMVCIILVGIVFYLKGDFFYHIFYPKKYEFSSQLNLLAASAFVLYCLENMFVVNTVFKNQPKKYLTINIIGLVTLFSCWVIFYITHQISAITAFQALLIAQIIMIVVGLFYYPRLTIYLKTKNILIIFLAVILAIIINFNLSGSIQCLSFALIILLAAVRSFPIIKKLY